MDYSANFVKGMHGTKSPIFMRDPMELYDLHGFGMRLPHPPTAPTKVPKDVHWWERTHGGIKSSMTSPLQVNQGTDPLPMILRILRSAHRA